MENRFFVERDSGGMMDISLQETAPGISTRKVIATNADSRALDSRFSSGDSFDLSLSHDGPAGKARRARGRLRKVTLHQVRIPHPDARRQKAVYVGLRPERCVAALSDPHRPDTVQRGSLR